LRTGKESLVELTVLRREEMMEARAGPRACIQANDAIASEPGQISLFAGKEPFSKALNVLW